MLQLRAARRGALAATRALRTARHASTQIVNKEPSDPQLGDYPDLPTVYAQHRNPFMDEHGVRWDDIQNRRQFGQPLHAEDDALGIWSPDVPHVPPQRALFHFMIAVSLFVGYAALVPALQVEPPVARRSYPYDGLSKELGGLEQNKARAEAVDDE
ncbi:hypothetical protein BKA62DRAFT_686150 [Auriculariales sp. MPI-PUGE-AT-0066]|nr:hypothetical protein BKA62DRAFT_686150 [Auriculariales sp. MPI-PUGE-AT-0066]